MSAIDQYKHKHIGFIECPSSVDFVYNSPTRKIAIYELLENVPNYETDIDGKIGDIILGGGSGEAPAFRISIPEAILALNLKEQNEFEQEQHLFKSFWTPKQSEILCEGFAKIGWSPINKIENWIAENTCLLIVENLEQFANHRTNLEIKSKLEFFSTN